MNSFAKPVFRSFTYTLAGGQSEQINFPANYIACLSATDGFKVGLGQGAPESDFEAGLQFRAVEGWTHTILRNPNASAVTVTIQLGIGDVRDSRLSIPAGTALGQASGATASSSAAQSVSATSVASVLAENANRRQAIICNDDSAAAVYVRFGNTAAAGGVKLQPGGVAILETTAQIYVYNPSGGAVDILASEIAA